MFTLVTDSNNHPAGLDHDTAQLHLQDLNLLGLLFSPRPGSLSIEIRLWSQTVLALNPRSFHYFLCDPGEES